MNNAIIIGTGKIGIDLYIKLKRNNIFDKIFIFNTNKFSEGAKYCKKKKFLYYDTGVNGVKKNLNSCNVIFDCTSANTNMIITKKLKNLIKNKFYINLTPSTFGKYVVPYFNQQTIPNEVNLITCGGQTSIPIISLLPDSARKKPVIFSGVPLAVISISGGVIK